jgi:D-aminoacyl-tRNA deacylase
MRVVLQRVSKASVTVEGRVVGSIDGGLLLLVGFTHTDTLAEVAWMADKVVGLRIFQDAEGRMNCALDSSEGASGEEKGVGALRGVLVVSQFTLYGDARKGRRPSFIDAARPETAVPLYEAFVEALRGRVRGPLATGEFGAMMDVALVNDGPVTLVLEREAEA